MALQLRERSFQRVLSDRDVLDALIAATPWRVPHFDTCLCCCYPTVTHGEYDVCWNCGWFDDVPGEFDRDDPHVTTNHGYSLNEARRNSIDHGVMYPPSDHRYAGQAAWAADRARIIEVYDELLPDVSPRMFIAALPRLNALHRVYYERRYGKPDHKRTPPARMVERDRVYRETAIRRVLRRRPL